MKNPYALLNYDMENNTSTPEFEKATAFITDTITSMVNDIKAIPNVDSDVDSDSLSWAFYGNLHWGSIGEKRSCGNSQADEIMMAAVKKLRDFSNGPEDDGGIGDTATDESIAYEVENLMNA